MKYKNYPADLRQKICDILETESHTRREVAEIFQIPYSTVCDIYNAYLNNNDNIVLPKPKGKKKKKLQLDDINFIKRKINEDCTQTLEHLRDVLLLERGKKVSLTTIANEIVGFKYSFRRVDSIPITVATDALFSDRKEFAAWFLRSNYQEGKVIYLSQMKTSIAMRKFSGRSKVGDPARVKVPKKKLKHFTTIAAIAYDRVLCFKVLNHADNTEELTLTFINELLANLPEPGYTIVMDHVQTEAVKLALKNAGHILQFLPANSPNFNPVEYLFSQLESFIRMVNPSNEEQLIAAINSVDERVSTDHIQDYFNHVHQNCHRCLNNETTCN